MKSNDEKGVTLASAKTIDDRTHAAGLCSSALQMSIPLLIDGMDNRVGEAYSGFPDRLYLVGADGRVAYKSGRGPFGFKPRELEQALALELIAASAK